MRQDVDSALYWLAKAAAAGDAKAANNLGYLLANSDVVTRDYPQAIYWLTKAASAGPPCRSKPACRPLSPGSRRLPDTALAESLYTKAIENGTGMQS